MEDLISTQITTFFAHMPRMTLLSVSRSFYLPVTKFEVKYLRCRGSNSVIEFLPSKQGVNCGAVLPSALFVHVFSSRLAGGIIQSRGG